MKILSILNNPALIMSWLAMSVKLGGNLILISIIVYFFDANDLLFWFNISFLIVFQGMFDVGFGSTFSRFVSYLEGKKNNTKYKKQIVSELPDLRELFDKKKLDFFAVLAIMKKIYLYLFFITFILLTTLGSYFFSNTLNQTSDPSSYWYLWLFYCFSFSTHIYGGMYSSILIGLNKIHILKKYESYIQFFTILIQSVLIFLGSSLLVIVLILSLSQLISVYINFIISKRYASFNLLKNINVDRKNFYYLIKMCFKVGIGTFFYCLANQFFVIYISNTLLVKESTGMLTLFRFAKVIENYSLTITNVQLPNLTRFFYLKNYTKYFEVSKINNFISILFMFICFISTSLVYPVLILILENKMIIPDLKYWIFLGFSFLIIRHGAYFVNLLRNANIIIIHIVNTISALLAILFFTILGTINYAYTLPLTLAISHLFTYYLFSLVLLKIHLPLSKKYFNFNFAYLIFTLYLVILAILVWL